MNVRRMILVAAAAALASQAGAQDAAGGSQEPPSGKSRTWYQKDAQKARELGQRGAGAAKKGAAGARDEVNKGGQALNSRVVGTRTVTGTIADVSPDQVTVQGTKGAPLKLRITKSTKVTVGGKKGAASALEQGDEVRASYAESGGAATATKIDVKAEPGSSQGAAGTRASSPPGPSSSERSGSPMQRGTGPSR